MIDYLIKNGIVIDGSGNEPKEANIGISGQRVCFIGQEMVSAKNVIDAKGLIVSPGFIDAHAHSEFTLLADNRAEGKISQGVTTEVNGNCGLSAAPLYGEALKYREADLRELEIKERWSTLEGYFSLLEKKGMAINFATLCGHGNIRASVMGYKDEKPDNDEMADMKKLLKDAVQSGAKGLSTGLIYPPGIYADTDELIELCSELQTMPPNVFIGGLNSKLIYASHIRSEGDKLIESIEEAIKIGERSGVHVHISHIKTSGKDNWKKIEQAVDLMEGARNQGISLTCDRYPYIASSTDLDAILPAWMYEGGRDEEIKRLTNPDIRAKLKAVLSSKDNDYWKGIYISSVRRKKNKWMEGENIYDIAHRISKSPVDAICALLIDEGLMVGAVFFSMQEENLERFLSLPYIMLGSDSSCRSFSGVTRDGKPHPRGFGTFPRFLSVYVRNKKGITLSEAVKKITGFPARTFGLIGRGLLKQGFYADITIFDYERLIDKAAFNEPFQKAEGIEYVFVNGSPAYREGTFTNCLSGKVLR